MTDEKDTQKEETPVEEKVGEEAVSGDEEKKEEKQEEAQSSQNDESASDDGMDVEVPEKFKDIVEAIENMSVLDLNELVKLLEKKFGVSAAAVAVASSGSAGGEEEADGTVTVELTAPGDGKVAVIKAVKEILGLGLKEAKELVDAAPSEIKKDISKDEATEIKNKLEEAGASVTIK